MKRQRWISWTVFTTLCGLAALALAAGITEFRTASTLEGCSAIPYQYMQDECHGYQKEVNKECKTKPFRSEHREVEKLIAEIKDTQRKLDEAKSRNNRDAIPNLENTITELRKDVNVIKAKAPRNILQAEECLNARLRVQDVFKAAKTSVTVQAKTETELKPYAEIIVTKFDTGAAEHTQAIADAKNAKKNWNWVKDVPVP